MTTVKSYFDELFYVGFDINGCELGLHPQDETVTKGNQTVTHWAVNGIEDCVQQLIDSGASVLYNTQDLSGGIKVATLIDPWENAAGLIEEK